MGTEMAAVVLLTFVVGKKIVSGVYDWLTFFLYNKESCKKKCS